MTIFLVQGEGSARVSGKWNLREPCWCRAEDHIQSGVLPVEWCLRVQDHALALAPVSS